MVYKSYSADFVFCFLKWFLHSNQQLSSQKCPSLGMNIDLALTYIRHLVPIGRIFPWEGELSRKHKNLRRFSLQIWFSPEIPVKHSTHKKCKYANATYGKSICQIVDTIAENDHPSNTWDVVGGWMRMMMCMAVTMMKHFMLGYYHCVPKIFNHV